MRTLTKLAVGAAVVGGTAGRPAGMDDGAAIMETLNTLHKAAAEADEDRYFALFTPDAVFMGTDATERWSMDQFKEYAMPIFTEREVGWVYTLMSRNIVVSPCGHTAWFDETLRNAKYGECRGTGALLKIGDTWKLAQYNLTVPIPNDLLEEVAGMIRGHEAKAR